MHSDMIHGGDLPPVLVATAKNGIFLSQTLDPTEKQEKFTLFVDDAYHKMPSED